MRFGEVRIRRDGLLQVMQSILGLTHLKERIAKVVVGIRKRRTDLKRPPERVHGVFIFSQLGVKISEIHPSFPMLGL